MANEVVLVGDIHANELKVLNWQMKCRHECLPVKILDYPTYVLMGDTFTRIKDEDFKKCCEVMDELAKFMVEQGIHFDTRTNR